MRHIPGLIGGLCSGFLANMSMFMLMYNPEDKLQTPAVPFLAFFGAWIASHYLIVKGTKGFNKPMARAFLIGAGVWMWVLVTGIIYSGKAVVEATSTSTDAATTAGATLGGGLFAMVTGTVSMAMALMCAIGFLIFHLLSKQSKEAMEDDIETKPCPDCAEVVNKAARICKHCKYQFDLALHESA